jgi:GT2 family glycosyltransferase
MISNERIAIIILNWNGIKDTMECLSSLKSLDYPHFTPIVVDNGSTDFSVAMIKNNHPEVYLIELKENLGFAGGCNAGIRHAIADNFDYICLLNNDTVVDPAFLSAFISRMKKEPKIGILGAKILMYSEKNRLDHLGGIWKNGKAEFELIGNRMLEKDFIWDSNEELDYVCGAAFFVKKEVFETIGLLEEKFFLIWEEADFCFRARKAGFLIKACLDAKLWHKVSASFIGKAHSNYFFWRNRLLWIERNLNQKQKKEVFKNTLNRELFHLWKMKSLKSIQMFVLTKIAKKTPPQSKVDHLLKLKACWQGVQDYKQRRFGDGPSWIYQKPSLQKHDKNI